MSDPIGSHDAQHELAHRISGRLEITLFCNADDNSTSLEIFDAATRRHFTSRSRASAHSALSIIRSHIRGRCLTRQRSFGSSAPELRDRRSRSRVRNLDVASAAPCVRLSSCARTWQACPSGHAETALCSSASIPEPSRNQVAVPSHREQGRVTR
jgi:hypothetical protein